MASSGDVHTVRVNTNELDDVEPFTDAYIGGLIDASTIAGATLSVWIAKKAQFAEAVDVTEAGASHKFSGLFANASAMVVYWERLFSAETAAPSGPRTKPIVRA